MPDRRFFFLFNHLFVKHQFVVVKPFCSRRLRKLKRNICSIGILGKYKQQILIAEFLTVGEYNDNKITSVILLLYLCTFVHNFTFF